MFDWVWIVRNVGVSLDKITLVVGLFIVVALYLLKAIELSGIKIRLNEIDNDLKALKKISEIFEGFDEGARDLKKIRGKLETGDEGKNEPYQFREKLEGIDKELDNIRKNLNEVFIVSEENKKIMAKNLDKTVEKIANLVKETRKLTDSVDSLNFIPAILIVAFGVILLIAFRYLEYLSTK